MKLGLLSRQVTSKVQTPPTGLGDPLSFNAAILRYDLYVPWGSSSKAFLDSATAVVCLFKTGKR